MTCCVVYHKRQISSVAVCGIPELCLEGSLYTAVVVHSPVIPGLVASEQFLPNMCPSGP